MGSGKNLLFLSCSAAGEPSREGTQLEDWQESRRGQGRGREEAGSNHGVKMAECEFQAGLRSEGGGDMEKPCGLRTTAHERLQSKQTSLTLGKSAFLPSPPPRLIKQPPFHSS